MSETTLPLTFDERAIDTILAEFNQSNAPGVAVGVAIDGVPVYRKAFGLVNREQPLVLSTATRMRIASVTKQFTSLAYLLLCERGKAHLDDTIGEYLPELNPIARTATMRQLMGHTSGLRDGCDWFLYDRLGRVTSAEVLAFYRECTDVNGSSGATLRYNDGAYLLIGMAIERISGRPLEDFLRTEIFTPIGMLDTLLCRWDDEPVPHCSAAHMRTPSGGFRKAFRFIEGLGQGGIVSTVDDLLRWLKHMSAPSIGQPSTWALMRSPQTLTNGTHTTYGLGLALGRHRDCETVWHGGMVLGATAQMLKVPAAHLDVVVLANRDDVRPVELANTILASCLSGGETRARADMPCVTGTFQSASTGRLIRLFTRDGQQLASVDAIESVFERSSEHTLQTPEASNIRRQLIELKGTLEKPASIAFIDHGNVDELEAVQALSEQSPDAIHGRYQCNPAGIEATIWPACEGPCLSTRSRFGLTLYKLESLAEGVWCARSTDAAPLSGILSFDADGAFRLTTRANWALPFMRRSS